MIIGLVLAIGAILFFFNTTNGWLVSVVSFVTDTMTHIKSFWNGVSDFGILPAAVITAVISVFIFKIIAKVLGR